MREHVEKRTILGLVFCTTQHHPYGVFLTRFTTEEIFHTNSNYFYPKS